MLRQKVQPWDDAVDCPQRSPYAAPKAGGSGGGPGDGGLPRGGVCLRCCASLSPTNQLMVRLALDRAVRLLALATVPCVMH